MLLKTIKSRNYLINFLILWVPTLFCFFLLLNHYGSEPSKTFQADASVQANNNPSEREIEALKESLQQRNEPTAQTPSKPIETIIENNDHVRLIENDKMTAWIEQGVPLERIEANQPGYDERIEGSKIYSNTVVLAAGVYKVRIDKRLVRIRIKNVEALSFNQRCQLRNDTQWNCGTWARRNMSRILRFKSIRCHIDLPVKLNPGTVYSASCWRAGRDIGEIIVREGYGFPIDEGKVLYKEAKQEAQRLEKGIWRR